jgi:hypothetical protein
LDEQQEAHEPTESRPPRRLRRTLGIGAMAATCAVAGAVAGAMTFPASHVGQAFGANTPLSAPALPTAATATCKTFAPPAGLPAVPGGGSGGGSVSAGGGGGSISVSGDTNKGVKLCATAPSLPSGGGGGSGATCHTFAPPSGLPAGSLPGSGSGGVKLSGGGGALSVSASSTKGATVCATAPSAPSGPGSGATCKSFSAPSSLPSLPGGGSGSGSLGASGGGGSISVSGGTSGGKVCVKPPSSLPSAPSAPSGATTGVPAKGQGTKPHKASNQTCTSTPGLPATVSLPGTASGGLSLSGGGTSISVKASKDGLKVCHGPTPSLPKPPSLPTLPGVPPVPASGGGSAPVLGDLPIPGL